MNLHRILLYHLVDKHCKLTIFMRFTRASLFSFFNSLQDLEWLYSLLFSSKQGIFIKRFHGDVHVIYNNHPKKKKNDNKRSNNEPLASCTVDNGNTIHRRSSYLSKKKFIEDLVPSLMASTLHRYNDPKTFSFHPVISTPHMLSYSAPSKYTMI